MTDSKRDIRTGQLLRELAPQVLGAVIRRFRDFTASEDAVQEALIVAATQWPRDGIPEEPRAWLTRVASRRMVDHVREQAARRRREAFVVSLVPPEDQLVLSSDDDAATPRDDTLSVLFMCCHPSVYVKPAERLCYHLGPTPRSWSQTRNPPSLRTCSSPAAPRSRAYAYCCRGCRCWPA